MASDVTKAVTNISRTLIKAESMKNVNGCQQSLSLNMKSLYSHHVRAQKAIFLKNFLVNSRLTYNLAKLSDLNLGENVSDNRFQSYTQSRLHIFKQINHNIYIQSQNDNLSELLFSGPNSESDSDIKIDHTKLSNLKDQNRSYSSGVDRSTNKQDPGEEQLRIVHNALVECLPKFFTETHPFNIYTPDIIFVNNIKRITINGIGPYMKSIFMYKILAHLKYSHVKLDILKITDHPEDGSVKVRWRIVGVSGLKSMLMFWKYPLFKKSKDKLTTDNAEWTDGFSTFYINKDAKIYKHVCDKMVTDPQKVVKPISLATKLVALIGIIPTFGMEDS